MTANNYAEVAVNKLQCKLKSAVSDITVICHYVSLWRACHRLSMIMLDNFRSSDLLADGHSSH